MAALLPWSWDSTTLFVLWNATRSSSALRSSFSSRITSSVNPATVVSDVCVRISFFSALYSSMTACKNARAYSGSLPVACKTKIVVLGSTVTFSPTGCTLNSGLCAATRLCARSITTPLCINDACVPRKLLSSSV